MRRVYTTTFETITDDPDAVERIREWLENKTRPAAWSKPTVVVMVSREADPLPAPGSSFHGPNPIALD